MKTRIILMSFSVMALTSCATLFDGGSPKILLEGWGVDEPVTITTAKKVYENVTLPTTVEVKRHKIEGQRISIQSENYKYQDIILQKKINGWTWGNIAIGGVIGWCIDMGTNCVSKPKETKYTVVYQRK
ncbi:hypothetical protein [Xylanibacter caecicola]|uniref:hypothetical protein n=1 Tax=Xylanibacter caecicola TaxID=2736294 RepID=UPI00258B9C9E|nr:hypothetical protein [Xylanibacter caecicola]